MACLGCLKKKYSLAFHDNGLGSGCLGYFAGYLHHDICRTWRLRILRGRRWRAGFHWWENVRAHTLDWQRNKMSL